MIIGQPGAGKSWLARRLGDATGLPVVHIDREVHWLPGWVESSPQDKVRRAAAIHARDAWIIEGGHSRSWPQRLARADTLIWLDVPLPVRVLRVTARTLRHRGQSRPDLPQGCPDHLNAEFIRYIWRTRRTARLAARSFYDHAPPHVATIRLTGAQDVNGYLAALGQPVPA
jgi:adenylate kinase family enzyme